MFIERERVQDMAKTKYIYFYKGLVVRNSNRLYKFGLLNHWGFVVACSANAKSLLSEKNRIIKLNESNLRAAIRDNDTELAECAKEDLENTKKWTVVELEVRES